LPHLPPRLAEAVEEEWEARLQAHEEAQATGAVEKEEPELEANRAFKADAHAGFHHKDQARTYLSGPACRVWEWMLEHSWLGEVYYTKADIADGMNLSLYYVRDILKELRDRGLVTVEHPNSKAQFYKLHDVVHTVKRTARVED
jgi:hypothetical protein